MSKLDDYIKEAQEKKPELTVLEPEQPKAVVKEEKKAGQLLSRIEELTAETIEQVKSIAEKYKYGFVTDIESDKAPKGLSEDIVRFISAKKNDPEWLLEWRLKAYRRWLEMPEPKWAKVDFPAINYQDYHYYSAPKQKGDGPKSLDEVDPQLLETYT